MTVLDVHGKKAECKNCIILLAVYGLYVDEAYIFTIEAVERERELEEGTSKIGILNKGQIHEYELTKPKGKETVLMISEMTKKECLKTYIKKSE